MSAIVRRGACPTLAAPMETGDGLLVRVNPLLQGLTPKQLIGLCKSAARNGNGIVEITARGSFQIRGLTAAGVEALARDVTALAISVRTGVPVETGPLAGLDPDETADPRGLAEAIRERIANAGLAARLGPKVSVVVDGGGTIGFDAVMADIRLAAEDAPGEAKAWWGLSIGGDARTARFVGVLDEAAACSAVVSILAEIAAMGVDARARDLDLTSVRPLVTSPSIERGSRPSAPVGTIKLTGRQCALGIALPFGSIPAESLIAFAEYAAALGVLDLRLSPGRALLALCHSAAVAVELKEGAKSCGFITDPRDPSLAISACPGAPACASGHFAAREIAAAIVRDARELVEPDTTLHVSGCPKGCAHPAPATFTLVGDENGIGLVVNGTARHTPLAYTQPQGLRDSLRRMVRLMAKQRPPSQQPGRIADINRRQLAAAFARDI